MLVSLTREPLDKTPGIRRLEEAATELYKALLAGRDTGKMHYYDPCADTHTDSDMAATMERLDEYRTHNSQFCQRLVDFLPVMITFQSKNILEDKDKGQTRDKLVIASHEPLETYLLRYQGLVRYLKEMDELRYDKLCAVCSCFQR
jgi:exocyst complex component 1